MLERQLERLQIGVNVAELGMDDLSAIFDEAAQQTEREIRHLLRDAKVDKGLQELATSLVIDFVVDASAWGGKKREMLFGVNRFEHVNAPGNPFEDKVPPTFVRFGDSLFLDEKTGEVYAFQRDDRARLEPGQIATIMGEEPERIRSFQHAQDFLAFQQSTPTKIADSLEVLLDRCAPCDPPTPQSDDYPQYE